jgi:hypothetical protein
MPHEKQDKYGKYMALEPDEPFIPRYYVQYRESAWFDKIVDFVINLVIGSILFLLVVVIIIVLLTMPDRSQPLCFLLFCV